MSEARDAVKMDKKILVTRSSMPPLDEYVDEIRELWDTAWLTNSGAKHREFEKKLSGYTSIPYVSLFVNGHQALENIIAAYNLKGEAITTPFTFVSTTHAIAKNGLKPVFCDINEENYTIDVSKIESLITKDTCAIVPVHVYGNLCDDAAIEKIAAEHGLKVIYDAAHAFGVFKNGESALGYGDASMCSFHATKAFHSIEGGAAFMHSARIKEILEAMKNFGMTSQESVDYISGNAKMNEFQAAMGICSLRHFKDEVLKRKKNAERYYANLAKIDGIKLCIPPSDVDSNYAYMPALFEGYFMTRDEVVERLAHHNIFARKYFFPATNDLNCYKDVASCQADTPTAKRISENIVTLPLYADLTLDDVDRICGIITEK